MYLTISSAKKHVFWCTQNIVFCR